MKLRTKILLFLIPLVVLPLLSLGWVAYGELRAISEEKLFDDMRSSLERMSAHVQQEIATANANIELFQKNSLVRKYVLTKDQEERYLLLQAPLLRVFGSYQEAFPHYYEIRIVLLDGYEDIRRTNIPIDNLTEDESRNPFFASLVEAGDQVVSSLEGNPDNGRFSLFVGKPLILRDPAFDATGTAPSLRGYLILTISLDNLETQIMENRIGKTGYLLATDTSGAVVYKPETVDTSEADLASLDALVETPGMKQLPGLMFNGSHSYIAHLSPFPGLDLVAVLPEQELNEASENLGITVAAIILITIVLTVICLYLVLQRLVIQPILQFRAMSKEIGRGNLDIKNQLQSRDEIGDLAKSFEDMARNLKRSDEQIRYVAYHDSLTGLPNRAMFKEYLSHVIGYSRRAEKHFALLFLDIDDFKRVNDTLGHQAGDNLLQEVTERLSDCLRKTDYVARVDGFDEPDEILARLGGDEFVVLLPDIHDPHAPGVLAQRLLKALAKPVSIEDHEIYISASIGITLYPLDGDQADELIKCADIAMYHAKERGKNDYQYYMESMNELAHERMAIEGKLRKALQNNELSLYYQPQVDPLTRQIVGLEALLRWVHPEDGFISPGVFIPVAEEAGLILDIGAWVLNAACEQSRAWQKAGLPKVVVSVNISSVQFMRQNVPELIQAALQSARLEPRYLEVEITESTIMAQPERAVADLLAIRKQGVRIALDDFGTGYSSFSYLHKFPIDTLKIDRSFVQEIGSKEHHNEIIAAMIAMAHILKLRVVAEGIETTEQLDLLIDKDCDIVQGFLFSKPIPAQEIPQLLSQPHLKTA